MKPTQLGARAVLSLLALGASSAQAQWFGSAALSSNHVERSISQSGGDPTVQAGLGWRHASGVAASLGLATVSKDDFVGSDGYKLMPEIAWSIGPAGAAWHGGVSLRGQYFPGAFGAWFGKLPPAAQSRVQQVRESNYGTLELGASVGYEWATLSWVRSLTDYLGLAAKETGPLGTKVLESKGTTYLGLDLEWPLGERFTLSTGIGRLSVPNFDRLSYGDWRLGLTAKAWDLVWALQASGNDADKDAYRPRARGASKPESSAAHTLTVSVALQF
jgi:hypothetical protein